MKKHYFFIFTLAVAVLLAGHVVAQDKPCMKSKTDAACCKGDSKIVSLDYEGKTLYFCCASSMEKFKADPEKYFKAMEAKGLTFGSGLKLQETCPVMGGMINKEYFVQFEGATIFACCAGCIDKIKADPAHYVKVLQEKGETPVLCLSEGSCSGKFTSGMPCPKTGAPTCTRAGEKEAKPQT